MLASLIITSLNGFAIKDRAIPPRITYQNELLTAYRSINSIIGPWRKRAKNKITYLFLHVSTVPLILLSFLSIPRFCWSTFLTNASVFTRVSPLSNPLKLRKLACSIASAISSSISSSTKLDFPLTFFST